MGDTPIGPYFEEFLANKNPDKDDPQKGLDKRGILSKQDLEIMKGLLEKAWLEDFHKFVLSLGGTTSEVLGCSQKRRTSTARGDAGPRLIERRLGQWSQVAGLFAGCWKSLALRAAVAS